MPEDMPGRMPDRMSEGMPDKVPECLPDRMPEDLPNNMPEDMPDRMPDRMPEDMPEDVPGRMPEDMPNRMPEGMPDRMPDKMSDRMPEDLPVTKCINVMVGITRSKVIYSYVKLPEGNFILFTCIRMDTSPALDLYPSLPDNIPLYPMTFFIHQTRLSHYSTIPSYHRPCQIGSIACCVRGRGLVLSVKRFYI